MRPTSKTLLGSLAVLALLTPRAAQAFGKQGDFVQTDTLGASLVSHDFQTGKGTDIAKVFNLSEFVGLHRYVADTVRVGMNVQVTERIGSREPVKSSRFQRLALLPQVGWNFYGPLFGALVFGVAPRTAGRANLNLTLQGVLGVSIPMSDSLRLSIAGEVPYTYYDHSAIGFTALTGIAIRL